MGKDACSVYLNLVWLKLLVRSKFLKPQPYLSMKKSLFSFCGRNSNLRKVCFKIAMKPNLPLSADNKPQVWLISALWNNWLFVPHVNHIINNFGVLSKQLLKGLQCLACPKPSKSGDPWWWLSEIKSTCNLIA